MELSLNESALAPVVLFVYKRFEETKATLEALQRNHLASESDLIVYADAAKAPEDQAHIDRVRSLFADLKGFRSVRVFCQDTNQGLARSIIAGVSEVLDRHGRAIVLEDDLVTSANFLDFMNQALDFYRTMPKIFAVSGFAYPLGALRQVRDDVSFSYRSYSWGWATWKDRWDLVDWDVRDHGEFSLSSDRRRAFNRGGSDLAKMLDRQQSGQIDSWMVRWVYTQHRLGLLDVFPKVSKVMNIGFGDRATHTRCSDRRYRTVLDDGMLRTFHFDPLPAIAPAVQKEWEWFHSYLRRAWYRLLNLQHLGRGKRGC